MRIQRVFPASSQISAVSQALTIYVLSEGSSSSIAMDYRCEMRRKTTDREKHFITAGSGAARKAFFAEMLVGLAADRGGKMIVMIYVA